MKKQKIQLSKNPLKILPSASEMKTQELLIKYCQIKIKELSPYQIEGVYQEKIKILNSK